ncbi:hypothetical protein ACFYNO_14345 [Kitasatospora sp. NPDC006697]|uniref:hypothetical protein n=1 Tax=Kitasatospora sp. NPDC006697 TaxID=3364020 RepID=UPI0036811EDA
MSNSPRTSPTHFSRIARRLDDETGMGYQKALAEVRNKADEIMRMGGRLDAAGRDMALRLLLHQSIEFWGPGVGAHPWPQSYHPVSMTWSPSRPCEEAFQAAARAGGQGQPEPTGDEFDPSYLAAAGVEPLDYYGTPDDEEWDEDGEDGAQPSRCEPVDEPDRWQRHVLTQGVRAVYRLPVAHSLEFSERAELQGLPAPAAAARLENLIAQRPAAVEAYVLRAEQVLAQARERGEEPDRAALVEARRWYECAVAVAEVPLQFPLYDGRETGPALPWRVEANRPLLRALHGLAGVAHRQKRWNTAEMILFRLLYLDPQDQQDAAPLLSQVREAAGLLPPDRTSPTNPGPRKNT